MILSGNHASSAEVRRFLSEAEAVAAFKHASIVEVYEVGQHNNLPFMALEYVAGGSLSQKLKQGPLRPKVAAQMVEQIAHGMNAAHQAGIVHRDLKPANILLTEQGTPKVTDFGLAKRVEGGSGLTQTGAIMGTPSYMAPEQASGQGKRVGPAADVYALGAILYECLTGRPPFRANTPLETVMQMVREEPKALSAVNPRIPKDLETICLKCLQKDPLKRYASAEALAEDLRRWQQGETVSVRPAGRLERLAKWAKRKPTLAAAYSLTVVSLLLIGLVAGTVWLWQRAEIARIELTEEKRLLKAAKDELAQEREKLAHLEFGRTMQVAEREWWDNNVAATLALLESTRPDLRGWEWHYMHRLCHGNLLTLNGHTNEVTSASFNREGSRIVTGSADKTARVWDATTGAELLNLQGHSGSVRSAAFSRDGSRIVTGSADKTARVWDAKTGVELLVLKGHAKDVFSASFSPDGSRIVTASADTSAKVWDAKTGAELLNLQGHSEPVRSASFNPDGSRIVTGSDDKTVKVWNAKTGAELLSLRGHSRRVCSALFSPDGVQIVSSSDAGRVEIRDARPLNREFLPKDVRKDKD